MVKVKFGKNWSWCNEVKSASQITDKHIDLIYSKDAIQCFMTSCKTNCATNPYCLNGLGEKKLVSLLQKEPVLPLDRGAYLRDPKDYAGLINLGATCYINTYLQVWYNNVIFREYILQAPFGKVLDKEGGERVSIEKGATADEMEKVPAFKLKPIDCIGKCLQIVFTLMKESTRKSIDPNFFIKALGLDENMQQDAQEFSQLFLTTLQSSLVSSNFVDKAFSTNNTISSFTNKQHTDSNIINDLFQGECSYITECKSCGFSSIRHSNFIELSLSLQNCSTILECIDDSLKPEMMEGDNQYFCSNCNQKQNAQRSSKLTSLPPVLNLQLLRFVYDRSSGIKKKLSTKIKFSEVLDLKKYVDVAASEVMPEPVYQLGAILMHVGKTAYSGHYMAQIKNFQKNEWYNFNDEIITKLKKKQQLGNTDEDADLKSTPSQSQASSNSQQTLTDDQTTSIPNEPLTTTTSNKTFSTANAYLLVYYRTDLLSQTPSENQIAKLSNQTNVISQDNQVLESWFTKLSNTRQNENDLKTSERELVNSIYNKMWVNTSSTKETNLAGATVKSKGKEGKTGTTTAEAEKKTMVVDLTFSGDDIPKDKESMDTETAGSMDSVVERSVKDTIPTISFYGSHKPKIVKQESNETSPPPISNKPEVTTPTSEPTTASYIIDLTAPSEKATKQTKQDDLYYISTDYLRKFLLMQHKISQTAEFISAASIQKYLCQHRRLNPLTVGKFKLVRKEAIDALHQATNLKYEDLGVLEANSFTTTKCRQCIINCYEYLTCKERIKSDAKTLRNLLKTESINDGYMPTITSDEVLNEDQADVCHDENMETQNNQENKENCTEKTYYWVGKESLRLWTQLALKKMEAQLPYSKASDLDEIVLNGDDTNEVEENADRNGDVTEIKTDGLLNDKSNSNAVEEGNTKQTQPAVSGTTAKVSFCRMDSSTGSISGAENSAVSLSYFNEDLLCPHRGLSTTQNKRLVSSVVWHQIFEAYFYQKQPGFEFGSAVGSFEPTLDAKVFTNESRECKICQKHNEENDTKKLEIKNQKEILSDLYLNKYRPNLLSGPDLKSVYYLIPTEFLKTWRTIIKRKTIQYKGMQIDNNMILCPHEKLAFNESTIDSALATIITEEEWIVLISSFKFDRSIRIHKMRSSSQHTNFDTLQIKDDMIDLTNSPRTNTATTDSETDQQEQLVDQFLFDPDVCEICMEQNELEKYLFDNKKIAIRQIDEDSLMNGKETESAATNGNDNEDSEAVYAVNKKARLNGDASENGSSSRPTGDRPSFQKVTSQSNFQSSRRSKRSRKCKGDIEVYISSFDTIKKLKTQMVQKLSRMISEQHLFFQNIELENDKTLAEYKIHYTDVLYLKLDSLNINEEHDTFADRQFAHLPEIGFKGTNLISR